MIIFIYIVCLTYILGVTELVVLIIIIELLSWIFIFFIKKFEVFKYLLIQTVFLLVRLISILWYIRIIILVMLLKLGIPPFHLWFINLTSTMNKYSFLFITTVHKILPLFRIRKFLYTTHRYLIILVILRTGILIIERNELFNTLIVSSIIHRGWILVRRWVSIKIIFLYYIIYSLIISLFVFTLKIKSLWYSRTEQNRNSRSLWIILSGFPPFSLFWLKVILLSILVFKTLRLRFILILVSVIRLFVYYRIFHFVLAPARLKKEQVTYFPVFMRFGTI